MGLNKLNHNFNEPLVSSSETTGSLVAGSAIVQGSLSSASLTAGTVTATNISATNAVISNLVASGPKVSAGTFTSPVLNRPVFNTQGSVETVVIVPAALSSLGAISLDRGAIWYFTVADFASINFTIYATSVYDNSNRVIDQLSVGQSLTAVLLLTQGSTGYLPNAYYLDNNLFTPKWAGGTAPTASTNAIDALTFTIIKTSATAFTVLGSATKYA